MPNGGPLDTIKRCHTILHALLRFSRDVSTWRVSLPAPNFESFELSKCHFRSSFKSLRQHTSRAEMDGIL